MYLCQVSEMQSNGYRDSSREKSTPNNKSILCFCLIWEHFHISEAEKARIQIVKEEIRFSIRGGIQPGR